MRQGPEDAFMLYGLAGFVQDLQLRFPFAVFPPSALRFIITAQQILLDVIEDLVGRLSCEWGQCISVATMHRLQSTYRFDWVIKHHRQ